MNRNRLGVQFQGDAIVLSGITGTKLKCETFGSYYLTWWGITSGGDHMNYRLPTAIVELNAGTGLDYIEDTGETVLGSSGHALQLKAENPNATNLKVVLIEEDRECYDHLKNVIRSRWPRIDVTKAEEVSAQNTTGVYLLNKSLAPALEAIKGISLGNSLFFFDPLLFTPWNEVDKVAAGRIVSYYQTRTEFVVFLFTSDWFRGRKALNLSPIPETDVESKWDSWEHDSVRKMDVLFGGTGWRSRILIEGSQDQKTERLVGEYRKRLHKWFRYVRPMPFRPKQGQMYHLFMCTNYERGIGITTSFYNKFTNHRAPKRDLSDAYSRFRRLHPGAFTELEGKQKPPAWRFLVEITRDHDEGICDEWCSDLGEIEPDPFSRKECLQWLARTGYLDEIPQLTTVWKDPPQLYKLRWEEVVSRLRLTPPLPLRPLEPTSSGVKTSDVHDTDLSSFMARSQS